MLDLEFLGFDTFSVTITRNQSRFPDEPRQLKLAHWEAFALENSGCFGVMCQFPVTPRAIVRMEAASR